MKPERTENAGIGGDGVEFKHPAFGQIRASRVQGGHGVLYDSDFHSNCFITLEITGSTLTRSLSNDWHFSKDQKIEIAMTEAQWATFVSSLNFGSGTPCTLVRFNREKIPVIEWDETKRDMFKTEHDDRLSTARQTLDEMLQIFNTLKVSGKARAELKMLTERAKAEIGSNLEFTSDQFERHMEKTVERAKQEIHGHMTALTTSAGVESMKQDLLK